MKTDFPKTRVVSAGERGCDGGNGHKRLAASYKSPRRDRGRRIMRGPSSAEPSCEGLEFNVKE